MKKIITFALVVLLLITCACSLTVQAQPEEKQLKSIFEGHTVVAFGPKTLQDSAITTFGDKSGANVLVKNTFEEATKIADSYNADFVEIHCIQEVDEPGAIIRAYKAVDANQVRDVEGNTNDSFTVTLSCSTGVIFVGFETGGEATIDYR